jgi:uncharacterized peroxidase-related enzyme
MEHHGEFLRKVSKNDTLVEQLKENWREADIEPRLQEMLDYAEQLTTQPSAVNNGHIEKLREIGLSDRDILDLNQVVSYFNYVNRVADGLGIELEPTFRKGTGQ